MFHYTETIPYSSVPILPLDVFTDTVTKRCRSGWRILGLFAAAPFGWTELICVLGEEPGVMLDAFRCVPGRSFRSITPVCPQAHLFEREIYELKGIIPQGHPWLKPVRYRPKEGTDRSERPGPAQTGYYRIDGAEVHEVAVGPVHAGVIEPGHFRFQCYGENVMHLEIQLGFQHRDAEHLILSGAPHKALAIMENIAGDTAVGHATAYCTLLEKLRSTAVPREAHLLRRLALELERLANHTRDLGAIGGDTGFLPTSSWNGRITGDFLNITSELCGSRFGRNLLCPGGVKWTLDRETAESLLKRLKASYRDARGSVDVMLENSSVMARLTGTGRVEKQAALDLGFVGMAARSCGIGMDARLDRPLADIEAPAVKKRTQESGDVLARTLVRSEELDDAFASAAADLRLLAEAPAGTSFRTECPDGLPAGRLAVAQVEGWRGELCHIGITDENGAWAAYKIYDPSFHNWSALAMALRGEQISDFPLCNKSFNLSYCGHDL